MMTTASTHSYLINLLYKVGNVTNTFCAIIDEIFFPLNQNTRRIKNTIKRPASYHQCMERWETIWPFFSFWTSLILPITDLGDVGDGTRQNEKDAALKAF